MCASVCVCVCFFFVCVCVCTRSSKTETAKIEGACLTVCLCVHIRELFLSRTPFGEAIERLETRVCRDARLANVCLRACVRGCITDTPRRAYARTAKSMTISAHPPIPHDTRTHVTHAPRSVPTPTKHTAPHETNTYAQLHTFLLKTQAEPLVRSTASAKFSFVTPTYNHAHTRPHDTRHTHAHKHAHVHTHFTHCRTHRTYEPYPLPHPPRGTTWYECTPAYTHTSRPHTPAHKPSHTTRRAHRHAQLRTFLL